MRQLTCILIALAIGVYADEPEKLVNGIPTTIEQYPYAVSMRMHNQHMCGGSIISPTHILTAAHCVASLIENPSMLQHITIVTGTSTLNAGGEVFQVASLVYHENYRPSTYGYDIGLITLTRPISYNSRQQPINLPTRDVIQNDPLTIATWGSMGLGKPVHNNLQKLQSKCMLAQECQRYHNNMRIYPFEFCTLISYQTGNCHGDSGSGIIRGNEIAGLVSRGRPCAVGYPDVYTSVHPFLPWIYEKMMLF